MECQYCKKTLSSSYTLKIHQNKAKSCLKIQGKPDKGNFICKCGRYFIHKHHLLEHQVICISNGEYITEILKENEKLKEQNILLRQQVITLQADKLDIQQRYDHLAETAVKRSTTTNNTVNNILNMGVFDKSQEDIERLVDENYNKEYLLEGQKGVAKFTSLHILKSNDVTKPPIYLITDKSRGNGKYKVSESETVTDVAMTGLTSKVHPSIKKKAIYIGSEETNEMMTNEKLFDGYQEVFDMEHDNGIFRKELIKILEQNE